MLVAEVQYLAITDDGMLRAPIYLGLRDDSSRRASTVPDPRELRAAKPRRARRDPAVPGAGRQAARRAPRSRASAIRSTRSPSAAAGALLLPDGGLLRDHEPRQAAVARGSASRKADLFRHYLDVAPFILPSSAIARW